MAQQKYLSYGTKRSCWSHSLADFWIFLFLHECFIQKKMLQTSTNSLLEKQIKRKENHN